MLSISKYMLLLFKINKTDIMALSPDSIGNKTQIIGRDAHQKMIHSASFMHPFVRI